MKNLNKKFALKTLGSMNYFHGFKTYRDQSGLFLTQIKHTLDILEKAKMVRANPSSTPLLV